jgi:hypothetical protein
MKKVISLVELNVDNTCNDCKRDYFSINCICKGVEKNNDYYSIYSNFNQIKYIKQKDKPIDKKIENKENIYLYYDKTNNLGINIESIPYESKYLEYNTVKSGKRYR